MTVEEKFKEVLSSNVKDEELRNDLYEYGMVMKSQFHTADYISKYDYDIQKTRVILIVLLDNIVCEMLKMTDVIKGGGILCEWSLVNSRMVFLKNQELDMFAYRALCEVAELDSTTRMWTLKEEV